MEEQNNVIAGYARFLIDDLNEKRYNIETIDLLFADIESIKNQQSSSMYASHILGADQYPYTKEELVDEIKNFILQISSSQTFSEEEKQNIIKSIRDSLTQNVSSVATALVDSSGNQYTYSLLIDEIKTLIRQNKTNVLISNQTGKEYDVDMILSSYNQIINSQVEIISLLKQEIDLLKSNVNKNNERIINIVNNDNVTADALMNLNKIIKDFNPFDKII